MFWFLQAAIVSMRIWRITQSNGISVAAFIFYEELRKLKFISLRFHSIHSLALLLSLPVYRLFRTSSIFTVNDCTNQSVARLCFARATDEFVNFLEHKTCMPLTNASIRIRSAIMKCISSKLVLKALYFLRDIGR